MTRCLVTGGAGFIGSHLVDALVEGGQTVRVVDNFNPQVHLSKPGYLNPRVEYMTGDLRDPRVVAVALTGAEIVYHLAALVGVGQSMYKIVEYVEGNSLVGARLLQRIVDAKLPVRRMVVASSMSCYGEGSYLCPRCGSVSPSPRTDEQLRRKQWELRCPRCGSSLSAAPTSEAKPLAPTSTYAITKRDHEELFMAIGRAYSIPTVALRFFNVYGTRQSLSNPYTGVCSIFQSRIRNGHAPIVYEDGLQSRDFVSVHDIVQGLLLAGSRPEAEYQVFNLGTGQPQTILSVAQILVELSGKTLSPIINDRFRSGDVRHCIADISKARNMLGYEPKTDFRTGMREFIGWSRDQTFVDKTPLAIHELERHGLLGPSSIDSQRPR